MPGGLDQGTPLRAVWLATRAMELADGEVRQLMAEHLAEQNRGRGQQRR